MPLTRYRSDLNMARGILLFLLIYLSDYLLGSSTRYLTMAADLQVAMQLYTGFLNQEWHELPIVRWLEGGVVQVGMLLPSLSGDGEEMEEGEVLSLSGDGVV